jgi:hypothetical protein
LLKHATSGYVPSRKKAARGDAESGTPIEESHNHGKVRGVNYALPLPTTGSK